MKSYSHHYIDGVWVEPSKPDRREIVNPNTEAVFASVANGGTAEDVHRAVVAARRAFGAFSRTSVAERVAMIDRIIVSYKDRMEELADVLAQEVGVPKSAAAQVTGPIEHMKVARDLLDSYRFEQRLGDTIIRREPVGVCALISPWNWPVQTPVIKFVYALAAGCTSIMKGSDASPLSSILLTEIIDKADLPPGVFNLVLGRGSVVGEALSRHPDVDLVSFTGSTSAGIKVGEAAASTIKRVTLELGGKSANIVLKDADLEAAARWNIERCFFNTGQSCHAPSRMLIHEDQMEIAIPHLVDQCTRFRLGDACDPNTTMGPVINQTQYENIRRYIQSGIDEGAKLVCGGLGRPEGLDQGFFIQPTVFSDVTATMTIAKEEIFGPVLAVIPYRTEEEALEIANDSIYGLGGYVFSADRNRGREFANALRAGRICVNGAPTNPSTPMGGYKQSGIGRSMGSFGLEEYLEIKSVYGLDEEAAGLPELIP
ncbi:aldehyde dehydrogenase family protein [Alcaligenaceae bacterium]|nr:aldehyde dehydrogenase family protein [Alcaligenaceae bacterium]